MFSKALVVGAYQKKAEELASLPGVKLTVLVPPFWEDAGHRQYLERAYASNYDLRVSPIVLNGHFHTHFYPDLPRLLRLLRPDILHADEEPYNLATFHAMWFARRLGIRTLFFTWQNLHRRVPPPYGLFEGYCLRAADYALAGNQEAVSVLRRKGFRGRLAVIPQFGIDPALYRQPSHSAPHPFTVGYLGRLVEQKGLAMLLEAVGGMSDARLLLVGAGPMRSRLEDRASRPDLRGRVSFRSAIPSVEVPSTLAEIDVLVLPSLTRSNWKEQFGRVLIEAMACGVPVVGSSSGEIPNVIADAGKVFPEGDVTALRSSIAALRDDPEERRRLVALGRARVLTRYTQAKIAEQTHAVYKEILHANRS